MKKFTRQIYDKELQSFPLYDIDGKEPSMFVAELNALIEANPNYKLHFDIEYSDDYNTNVIHALGVVAQIPETDEAFEARKVKAILGEKARAVKKKNSEARNKIKAEEAARKLLKKDLDELKRLKEKYGANREEA
jgi:hypothetical protein